MAGKAPKRAVAATEKAGSTPAAEVAVNGDTGAGSHPAPVSLDRVMVPMPGETVAEFRARILAAS